MVVQGPSVFSFETSLQHPVGFKASMHSLKKGGGAFFGYFTPKPCSVSFG